MSKSIEEVKKEIWEENYNKVVAAIWEVQAKASLAGPLSGVNRQSIKEKWVDEWILEHKKWLKYSGVIITIAVVAFFGIIPLAFLWGGDTETKTPVSTEQSIETPKEQTKETTEVSKPEDNSAYTNCMSQTEYLKWADKERLIKACEKNNVQDASLAKNQEYAKKHKWDIVIGCRKVIKEQLKQPSSADFRELSYYTNYQEIIYKTEVISKNDFNAEVRNIVMCTLDIKDGKPGTINAKLEQ